LSKGKYNISCVRPEKYEVVLDKLDKICKNSGQINPIGGISLDRV